MNGSDDSKRESVLRKVQALLDKAASTTFDAERDALIAKADEMMAKFAIEEFELATQGHARKHGATKPELRDIVVPRTGGDWRVSGSLESMFRDLSGLVGVRIGAMVNDRLDGEYRKVARCVGYPADLDYFQMLFVNLQLHFLSKMEPKPDASLSDLDNFIALWESGRDYRQIWKVMDWPWRVTVREHWCPVERADHEKGECSCECSTCHGLFRDAGSGDLVAAERKRLHSLRRGYHERCQAEGRLPMKGLKADTYRRSFIDGYAYRIRQRIAEMRSMRNEVAKGHELVIVSMKDSLDEFFFEMWPEQRPHPEDCQCDSCHYYKCNDEKCTRPRCVEYNKNKNKPVRARAYRPDPIDERAFGRGSSLANTADLSAGGVGGTATKGEVR